VLQRCGLAAQRHRTDVAESPAGRLEDRIPENHLLRRLTLSGRLLRLNVDVS
jgi:hypothetical protein